MQYYYISKSSFLEEPERGSFAACNIEPNTNIGLAIKFKSNFTRADIDWYRTELCKMTNHSFSPNIGYDIQCVGNETNIFFVSKGHINKDTELTIDYTQFPYKDSVDLSFLDPDYNKFFLYLTLDPHQYSSFKNYGIRSPIEIYKTDPYAFQLISKKYKDSTASFLDKQSEDISTSDIISYLKEKTKKEFWISESTVYFNLFSMTQFPEKIINTLDPFIELKIDYLKLHKFKPILLDKTDFYPKTVTWEFLQSENKLNELLQTSIVSSEFNNKIVMPKIVIKDVYHISNELFNLKEYRFKC